MTSANFITFEGGEGVGKTTQIKKLEQFLKSIDQDVVVTREPGGTLEAEAIRNLIFSSEYDGKWSPQAETLMMFAARTMHIRDVIQPALGNRKTVICDRFMDSTRVYQGIVNNVSFDFIRQLEDNIIGDFMPSLTFVLDLPADTAMLRVQSRGAENNNDRGDLEFYEKLRQGFLKIAKNEPERCIVIDADRSEEDIAQDIQDILQGKLS